ncbi:hypothetical protein M758_4G068700 [Ceratodon purpureus]|nr:hypothetical protein M758_4G068700 [Ceratodon purpureus]
MLALVYEGASINSSIMTPPSHRDEPPRGGYGGSAGGSLEAGPRSSVLPAGAVGEPEPKPEPKPEPEPGSGGNGGTGGNPTGMSEFWTNVICPFAVVTGDVNFGKCRVFNAHILFLLHSRRGIGLGFGAFRSLQVVAITKSLKAYIEIDNSKMSY